MDLEQKNMRNKHVCHFGQISEYYQKALKLSGATFLHIYDTKYQAIQIQNWTSGYS